MTAQARNRITYKIRRGLGSTWYLSGLSYATGVFVVAEFEGHSRADAIQAMRTMKARNAWKSAIAEENAASDALRSACVDGLHTEEMAKRCNAASAAARDAFNRWAEIYVEGGAK